MRLCVTRADGVALGFISTLGCTAGGGPVCMHACVCLFTRTSLQTLPLACVTNTHVFFYCTCAYQCGEREPGRRSGFEEVDEAAGRQKDGCVTEQMKRSDEEEEEDGGNCLPSHLSSDFWQIEEERVYFTGSGCESERTPRNKNF